MPEPPTAVFAASDTQAIGVLKAAEMKGLRVPDDLSVIGFDDFDLAEYMQLTTIRQPLYASGVEAVDLLLDAISDPAAEPQTIVLPLELIARQTTVPLA